MRGGHGLLMAIGTTTLLGCATAPIAQYRGAVPAALAIRAFDPTATAPDAFLVPGTTDRAGHRMGTLALPRGGDSVTVLVYGDNRPGPRLLTTPWGLGALIDADRRDPWSVLWGAVNVPVLLAQAVIPTLDGLQDLISSKVTHLYRAGGEARVLKALAREPVPALIVNTGDLVENGKRAEHWSRFEKRHEELRARAPFLAAPGNHERMGDPFGRFNWNAVMGVPPDTMRYWFSLDLPDSLARFVFIDSNLFADPRRTIPDSLQDALANEQLEWLDQVLDRPARWTFVVLHHPIVSAGQHHGDWGHEQAGFPSRRGRFFDLLLRHRVTAVLAGHEHLYQRLWLEGPEGRGLWQITTGGGGGPLHRISRLEKRRALDHPLPGAGRLLWIQPRSVYHYCRLVIPTGTGSPQLEVRRVRRDGGSDLIERVALGPRPAEAP